MAKGSPAEVVSEFADAIATVVAWPLGPTTKEVVDYDYRHVMIYVGLLNAEAHGMTESEMVRVLRENRPVMTVRMGRLAVRSHLDRAHWLASIKFMPLMWCLDD